MKQREIKFRHFDAEDGHFDYFTLADIDGDGMFPTKRGRARLSHYADELDEYTGLNDRNGKAIFEGDIVQGSEPWKTGPCVVEYRGSGFCKVGEIAGAIRSAPLQAGNAYFEIIGNIHEHPDLLKP